MIIIMKDRRDRDIQVAPVDLPDKRYEFRRDENGKLSCDVTNTEALKFFLVVCPEGYRCEDEAGDKLMRAAAAEEAAVAAIKAAKAAEEQAKQLRADAEALRAEADAEAKAADEAAAVERQREKEKRDSIAKAARVLADERERSAIDERVIALLDEDPKLRAEDARAQAVKESKAAKGEVEGEVKDDSPEKPEPKAPVKPAPVAKTSPKK